MQTPGKLEKFYGHPSSKFTQRVSAANADLISNINNLTISSSPLRLKQDSHVEQQTPDSKAAQETEQNLDKSETMVVTLRNRLKKLAQGKTDPATQISTNSISKDKIHTPADLAVVSIPGLKTAANFYHSPGLKFNQTGSFSTISQ